MAKIGFVGNRRARHGVLQTRNGATVALAVTVLAMLMYQRIEFVAARVQNTGQMQRYVSDVIGVCVPEFIGPLFE